MRRDLSAAEAVIDPDRPIVDAHHHLYERPGVRYLVDDYATDLASGHAIFGTVFVQARYGYDDAADEALRPVGETAFARRSAQCADATDAARFGIAKAIVPFADLMLGDAAKHVLEAHLAAGEGRVRGIRHILAWHADATLLNPSYPTTEDMTDGTAFRAGFRHLAALGLSFDAWVLFPQLPRLAALAQAFPDTAIVVDHCGGPLLGAPYAGRTAEVFAAWRSGMRLLADCPNVSVKLSGLGMPALGFALDTAQPAPASRDLAAAWRPWMETCIDLFGTHRAMFASNFPADRPSGSYAVCWNAMKRIAAHGGEDDKTALFHGTASRFYRLTEPVATTGRI